MGLGILGSDIMTVVRGHKPYTKTFSKPVELLVERVLLLKAVCLDFDEKVFFEERGVVFKGRVGFFLPSVPK